MIVMQLERLLEERERENKGSPWQIYSRFTALGSCSV